MSAINQQRVTVVLKPRPDEDLSAAMSFLTLGSTVQIGRVGAVVASIGEGDQLHEVELLQNQVTLAEAAMRRGALMHDESHLPALQRVISEVPGLYLEVSDQIKQKALDDGDSEEEAEQKAGQAIRTLIIFKKRLEKLLEPDLLTTQTPGSLITENPVVAESVHIDKRVKAAVAETSFLTIVFKLPTLSAAAPLIAQLPYGQKALGTNAEVFGLTTGNLMESMQ
ncbi:hypothetical protein [Pseudomonas syringae]|uniref:Uncharacterized protein n=1 Tax=Pseudomonas syringae TaxID=317 RepID=A0A085V6P2_PSESX|nr:hypothetical protein [Pseudomonas syringae]KFE51105.1 hypothetical protein IV02_13925 [Pseudomonas syringae]